LFFSFFNFICNAQVGINTTSPNAILDIKASNGLSPRIDEFSVFEPSPFQHGMIVFVTGNGTAIRAF